MSTPKNGQEKEFSVYDDIREKLLAQGVPESEIAFIHNADTEAKKKELFAKVRTGQVRILLGSTAKMGAGTNVQDRLIASARLWIVRGDRATLNREPDALCGREIRTPTYTFTDM